MDDDFVDDSPYGLDLHVLDLLNSGTIALRSPGSVGQSPTKASATGLIAPGTLQSLNKQNAGINSRLANPRQAKPVVSARLPLSRQAAASKPPAAIGRGRAPALGELQQGLTYCGGSKQPNPPGRYDDPSMLGVQGHGKLLGANAPAAASHHAAGDLDLAGLTRPQLLKQAQDLQGQVAALQRLEAQARQRCEYLAESVREGRNEKGWAAKQLDSARKVAAAQEAERMQHARRVEHLQSFLSREKAAREAAERKLAEEQQRSSALAAQLSAAQQQLRHMQDLLDEARQQYKHFLDLNKQTGSRASKLQDRLRRTGAKLADALHDAHVSRVAREQAEQQVSGLRAVVEDIYTSQASGQVGAVLRLVQKRMAEQRQQQQQVQHGTVQEGPDPLGTATPGVPNPKQLDPARLAEALVSLLTGSQAAAAAETGAGGAETPAAFRAVERRLEQAQQQARPCAATDPWVGLRAEFAASDGDDGSDDEQGLEVGVATNSNAGTPARPGVASHAAAELFTPPSLPGRAPPPLAPAAAAVPKLAAANGSRPGAVVRRPVRLAASPGAQANLAQRLARRKAPAVRLGASSSRPTATSSRPAAMPIAEPDGLLGQLAVRRRAAIGAAAAPAQAAVHSQRRRYGLHKAECAAAAQREEEGKRTRGAAAARHNMAGEASPGIAAADTAPEPSITSTPASSSVWSEAVGRTRGLPIKLQPPSRGGHAHASATAASHHYRAAVRSRAMHAHARAASAPTREPPATSAAATPSELRSNVARAGRRRPRAAPAPATSRGDRGVGARAVAAQRLVKDNTVLGAHADRPADPTSDSSALPSPSGSDAAACSLEGVVMGRVAAQGVQRRQAELVQDLGFVSSASEHMARPVGHHQQPARAAALRWRSAASDDEGPQSPSRSTSSEQAARQHSGPAARAGGARRQHPAACIRAAFLADVTQDSPASQKASPGSDKGIGSDSDRDDTAASCSPRQEQHPQASRMPARLAPPSPLPERGTGAGAGAGASPSRMRLAARGRALQELQQQQDAGGEDLGGYEAAAAALPEQQQGSPPPAAASRNMRASSRGRGGRRLSGSISGGSAAASDAAEDLRRLYLAMKRQATS